MKVIRYSELPISDNIGVFKDVKINSIVVIEDTGEILLDQILEKARERARDLNAQLTHWTEQPNKQWNCPVIRFKISMSALDSYYLNTLIDEFLDMDKPMSEIKAREAFYPPEPEIPLEGH